MITRKKISLTIPTHLIPSLKKLAKRNKWEMDDVVEEAFIHYLNSEHVRISYTDGMANKNWIQKAIKKPGTLKKELGIKAGNKIPAKKLAKAAKKGGKLGQRARLAETLKNLKK